MSRQITEWTSHARFHFAGPDPRKRAFFIGGFRTSTLPWEPIAKELNDRCGLTIDGIALPGHGSTETFHRYGSFRYLRGVRNEFLRVAGEAGEPIIVGGFSTGGAIALILAARYPELIRGVVLASPALHLANRKHVVMLWLGYAAWILLGLYVAASLVIILATGIGFYFFPEMLRDVEGLIKNPYVAGGVAGGLALATICFICLTRFEVDFGESERIAVGNELILGPFYRNVRFLVAASLVLIFSAARLCAKIVTKHGKFLFVAAGERDDLLDIDRSIAPFQGAATAEIRRYEARHAVMNAERFREDLVRAVEAMLAA